MGRVSEGAGQGPCDASNLLVRDNGSCGVLLPVRRGIDCLVVARHFRWNGGMGNMAPKQRPKGECFTIEGKQRTSS